ncbi:MAG: hypothetical protein C0485_19655 [Pirellula sp.]|nr:hypothetical protein [Pirellula sp.]
MKWLLEVTDGRRGRPARGLRSRLRPHPPAGGLFLRRRLFSPWQRRIQLEAVVRHKLVCVVQAEYPEAQFQSADLGEAYAWAVGGEWLYSTEYREGTIAARLIDEMGDVVLMIQDGDGTRFIRGARRNKPPES